MNRTEVERVPHPQVVGGRGARLGAYAVQFAIAAWVVSVARFSWRPWTFFVYYATLVVLVPALVQFLSNGRLTPVRRVYLAFGLALHPLAFFYGLYENVWWWDMVAHFVSASLLAGGGYAVAIGLKDATDLPLLGGKALHLWVFLFVLTGGVLWEFYELIEAYLVVYGPFDTAKDLVVDVIGWAVVAKYHPKLLGAIPTGFAEYLRGRGFGHARRRQKIVPIEESSNRTE